ncbi:MAG: hypothetical protein ACI8ZM_003651 [Crocinitomix sp.]|jgi:hypothetical protein
MKRFIYLILLSCSVSVQAQNWKLDSLMTQIKSHESHSDYNFNYNHKLHLDLIEYSAEMYRYTKEEKWNEKHLFFKQTRQIKKHENVYITSDFAMQYYLLDTNFQVIKTFDNYISSFRNGVSISYRKKIVADEDLPPNWNYYDKHKEYKVLINKKGEQINTTEFDDILFLSEGMLKVRVNKRVGIADSTGQLILPIAFKEVEYNWRRPNYFTVCNGEACGLVNREGKLIIPYEYSEILRLHEGEYIVAVKDEKRGVIDLNNNIIMPFEYGENFVAFNDSVFLGEGDYSLFLMNAKAEKLSPSFNYISSVQTNKHGFSKIKQYGSVGVVNTNNASMAIEAKYDEIVLFSDHIWVKEGPYEGIVDYEGNIIIPIEFTNIKYGHTYNRINILSKNGKYGIFDMNNELLFDFIYDDLHLNREMNIGLFARGDTSEIMTLDTKEVLHTFNLPLEKVTYQHLLALDPTGAKGYLYFNPKEAEISLYDLFDVVRGFDGFTIIRENGKFGVVNDQGIIIIPIEYEDYSYFDLLTDPSCDINLMKDDEWFRFNILGELMPNLH